MTDILSSTTGGGPPGLVPPQALDAERSVLAAMLLDQEAIGKAVEMVEAGAFYRVSHQKVFEALVALYNRNEKADLVTVAEELRKRGDFEAVGGAAMLAQLMEYATTSANIEHHIRIVESKAVLRQLIKAASEIQQQAYAAQEETPQILDRAEARIFEITDRRIRAGFVSMRDLLGPTFKYVEQLSERKVHVTGVGTGFSDLDAMTAGLQSGDLIILAGRPSMGKTALSICIAENAAIDHKVPVAIFSLEMSKESLALRMLCSQSRVSMQKVRTGYLGREDWPNLVNGAGLLSQAPIMIDDSPGTSLLEMRAKCRRLRAENKLGLVVIDYLQLMRPSTPAENRVQEISQISRGLKALAKELSVPIIALSQLSRAVEQRGGGGRPQLSDLRESGSLEQDADLVMFVYREVVYKPDTQDPNKAQLIVAKQRNGPVGEVDMTFLREYTKFVPYTSVSFDEPEPTPF